MIPISTFWAGFSQLCQKDIIGNNRVQVHVREPMLFAKMAYVAGCQSILATIDMDRSPQRLDLLRTEVDIYRAEVADAIEQLCREIP